MFLRVTALHVAIVNGHADYSRMGRLFEDAMAAGMMAFNKPRPLESADDHMGF